MGYTQSLGMTGGGGLALPNFRGRGQSFSFSFNIGTNVGAQIHPIIIRTLIQINQNIEQQVSVLQILWLMILRIC